MTSLEELSDDLTIHQVMLNSMDDQYYEGIEEERAEMRAEIAKLKHQINKAKQTQTAGIEDDAEIQSDDDCDPAEPDYLRPADHQGLPVPPVASAMSTHNQLSANSSHLNSSVMDQADRNAGTSFGTLALPTRKREWSSARFDYSSGPNKSRRTTPTPAHIGDPFSSASSRGIDFIDLTGDDEILADVVASQIKAETQLNLERADRQFALQLSNQRSPSPPPSTMPTQSNAFSRLMTTQQQNSRPSEPQHCDSDSDSVQEILPLPNPPGAHRMPGAYDNAWDSGTTNPAFEIPGHMSRNGIQMDGAGVLGLSGVNRSPNERLAASTARMGRNPFFSQIPPLSNDTASMGLVASPSANSVLPPHVLPYAGAHITGMPLSEISSTAAYPGSSNPSYPGIRPLSTIVNRVNNYDYVNGTDEFGNRLPERVTNYFHDIMHDSRVSEKELDDLLQNISPDMDLPELNRDGTPEGLKSTLYRHQEIALTWMQKMEEGSSKGGILADDMGLGKTVSTLSLILSCPAASRPKTTLIIGPLALLRQWEEEIGSKVKPSHRLSIYTFHGPRKGKMTTQDLLKFDVVLTTYMTLAAEKKRLDKMLEEKRQIDYDDKNIAKRFPLLHPDAKFYRVILDEAQCIKNRATQSAKACTALRATYRWCLSGTPMMNSVEELYSLLNFLKIKPYCDWERFRQGFGTLFGRGRQGDNNTTAMSRLRAILKACMLRRMKNSLLDGEPILKLPAKTEEIRYGELSTDERDFYNQLESKSQVIFNKYLREGSVGKNYSSILVLLLRLRQACCHPHLNLDVDDAASIITMAEMMELVNKLDPPIVNRIKEMQPPFECPICYDATQSPSFFVPCGHDSCSQCLAQLVDNTTANSITEGNDSSSINRARCPVCREWFDSTKCFTYEAFQKVHMPETIMREDEDDVRSETNFGSDSDENDEDVDSKGNLKHFVVEYDFLDSDEDDTAKVLEEARRQAKREKRAKKKARKESKGQDKADDVKPSMLKALRKDACKNRAAYKKYMAYLRKTWLTSAKVTECMKLLQSIQPSGEKTIIFSQWTLLLDLLEVAMEHEGFDKKPVRYDGGMSADDRNGAAHKFRNDTDVNVILVSLKAGNAGLNLAAASRVIILDPFWNPYTEMQAVDRAYRIGQTREVKVYRILTKETVEDRIIELQNRKKEMIESAMDESEGRKIQRLSTRELKFLFNGTR